jgi:hypothetical protein
MCKTPYLLSVGLFCLLSFGFLFSCHKTNPITKPTDSTTTDTTPVKNYYVTTLAGTGQAGLINGADSLSQFNEPWTIAVDNQGNVFVGDQGNFAIRKITPAGQVSTFAGRSINTLPVVDNMAGLVTDQQGNLFMPDYIGIREITPAGVNSVLAGKDSIGFRDGTDTNALFHATFNVAIDRQDNLYLVDFDTNFLFRVRKVTPAGVVTTLPLQDNTGINSDGTVNGSQASWNPWEIAVDSAGNIYVSAGLLRSSIKKITQQGAVSIYAGQATYGQVDGGKDSAKFYDISGLAFDPYGNLLVTEGGGNDVRKITPKGTVSTIAGLPGYPAFEDGQGYSAWFNNPRSIAIDRQGNIYVADFNNNRIRKIVYR